MFVKATCLCICACLWVGSARRVVKECQNASAIAVINTEVQNAQNASAIAVINTEVQNALVNETESRGPLDFLEIYENNDFDVYRSRQQSGTWVCWLLSVIEGLRFQGHILKMFSSGMIQASVKNNGNIQWSAPSGVYQRWDNRNKVMQLTTPSGTFESYSTIRGTWQLILESIFYFPQKTGREFQKNINPAPKNGAVGRAEDIQKYLKMISTNIYVQAAEALPLATGDAQAFSNFFNMGSNQPGTATIFQVDKGGVHAIAVETILQRNNHQWVLTTFNQAVSEDEGYPQDSYIVEPGNMCNSDYGHTCDSVYKYIIAGLPY